MTNATKQVRAGNGGTIPPVERRFGQPNGNPRNNGGLPKHVREIRAELKNLLNPNLSIRDYQKIVATAETDSGLMGVFATAIIKKDYRTILELMNQAYGRPIERVENKAVNDFSDLSEGQLKKIIEGDDDTTGAGVEGASQ